MPFKSKQNSPMNTLAAKTKAKLKQAVSFHQKGDLGRAKAIYEDILKIEPKHFDSLHLLGVLAYQNENYEQAVDLINSAIEIYPKNPMFHSNRGLVLQELKQFDFAIESYNKAIELRPDFAEAYSNRGNAQKDLKQLNAAVESYNKAIELNPNFVDANYNCGLALQQLKNFDEAVDRYNKAIELQPDFAEAYSNRGNAQKDLKELESAIESYNKAIELQPDFADAYSDRGNVLRELQQFDNALTSYDKAIELQPDFAEAYLNRGNTLRDLKQLDGAIESYNKAIDLQPNFADAYSNLGNALQDLKELDAAIESYDKAINLRPDFAEAYTNRGNAFKELGKLDEAVDSLEKAIDVKPGFTDAHWNLSLALLLGGDFQKGWQACPVDPSRLAKIKELPHRVWQGEKSDTRTLLIRGAEGIGEQLMYSQLLPLAQERVKKLIVECDKRLVTIFNRSFPEIEFVPWLTPPEKRLLGGDIEIQALPRHLASFFLQSFEDFPGVKNLLIPKDEGKHLADDLRARYPEKRLVGISWHSASPAYMLKSIPLAHWIKILNNPNVKFINLQYGSTKSEVNQVKEKFGIEIVSVPEIDTTNDIDGCMGLISGLDLVITVSNVTAHYAGNLGIPVWVLVSKITPLWHWFTERNDSPWYQTMRLFRQQKQGDWKGVFDDISKALTK